MSLVPFKTPYEAIGKKPINSNLILRCANGEMHSFNLRYYFGATGESGTLIFHFATANITLKGENLFQIMTSLNETILGELVEFDPEKHQKPEAGKPVITGIVTQHTTPPNGDWWHQATQ